MNDLNDMTELSSDEERALASVKRNHANKIKQDKI
jgi:hypothetical protein